MELRICAVSDIATHPVASCSWSCHLVLKACAALCTKSLAQPVCCCRGWRGLKLRRGAVDNGFAHAVGGWRWWAVLKLPGSARLNGRTQAIARWRGAAVLKLASVTLAHGLTLVERGAVLAIWAGEVCGLADSVLERGGWDDFHLVVAARARVPRAHSVRRWRGRCNEVPVAHVAKLPLPIRVLGEAPSRALCIWVAAVVFLEAFVWHELWGERVHVGLLRVPSLTRPATACCADWPAVKLIVCVIRAPFGDEQWGSHGCEGTAIQQAVCAFKDHACSACGGAVKKEQGELQYLWSHRRGGQEGCRHGRLCMLAPVFQPHPPCTLRLVCIRARRPLEERSVGAARGD